MILLTSSTAFTSRDNPQARARLSWLLPTVRVSYAFGADWYHGAKATGRPGLAPFPPSDITTVETEKELQSIALEQAEEETEEFLPDNGRRWQRGNNVSVGLWWQLDEWLNGRRSQTARQLHKKRQETLLRAGRERLALINAMQTCPPTSLAQQLDCLTRKATAKALLQRQQTFDAKKGSEGSRQ